MFFSEENVEIDLTSLELCYLFIPNYKVFHNFGVSLHPKYTINIARYNLDSDEFVLEILEKKSYFDLFENEQVNLKVICGKNGSGKSTLLKLLSGIENPAENKWLFDNINPKSDKKSECFYLYKDKNENFIATKPITIIYKNQKKRIYSEHESDISPRRFCANDYYLNDYFINKDVLENYLKYPQIFEGILPNGEPLFNKFEIRLWNFNENFKGIRLSNCYKLFANNNEDDVVGYFYSNWLLYYFFNILYYTKDISFIQKIESDLSKSNELFPDAFNILKKRLCTKYEYLYDETLKTIKDLQGKVYSVSKLSEAKKDIADLENKMNILIRNALGNSFNGVYPTFSSAYIHYSAYYEKDGLKRYFEDLSDGEQRQFRNRYQIYNMIKNKDAIFWYIDEVDKDLHPEWCRTFIYDYLQSYRDVKHILKKETHGNFNCDRRITLLFSTHSPLVLSDVTSDYVIYLEKNEETRKTTEKVINKNTFAGNIGEMFSANFFMNETIGKFAKEYLKGIIKELDSDEELYAHRAAEFEKVISSIGDDILRILLKDKLERKIEADSIRSRYRKESS